MYFKPLAYIDEIIKLVRAPNDYSFYRVAYEEPIPKYELSFMLGPSERSTGNELSDIVVGEDELLQFRISLDGLVKAVIWLPRGTARYLLRTNVAYLDPDVARPGNPLAELYIFENNKMYADLENLNADRYEKAKITIQGWRLVLEPVTGRPEKYKAAVIQGFAPKTAKR